ncbi:MAG: response regulator transcription factor [Bacteroidetes bacterium]|nr:response regulator transcription factor [Bacteroidota bacterium]
MNSLTALIVDDHLLFREGMESLLRKVPYIKDVLHAENGIEALKKVEADKPDILFMDINMPMLNGIETTRQIVLNNFAGKIIALTMMDDPNSVTDMFRAGADGYLLKNTSFLELQEAINCVCNGGRYFSKDVSHLMMDRMIDTLVVHKNNSIKTILTLREKDVVGLICRGFSNKDIAAILKISVKTVETHRTNSYAKLNVSNAADLAYMALKEGIVTREN